MLNAHQTYLFHSWTIFVAVHTLLSRYLITVTHTAEIVWLNLVGCSVVVALPAIQFRQRMYSYTF
jgi:hypothetical protein